MAFSLLKDIVQSMMAEQARSANVNSWASCSGDARACVGRAQEIMRNTAQIVESARLEMIEKMNEELTMGWASLLSRLDQGRASQAANPHGVQHVDEAEQPPPKRRKIESEERHSINDMIEVEEDEIDFDMIE